MKKLQGIDVVLVSANADHLEHLPVWLRSEGATLRTTSWADLPAATAKAPAIVLADLLSTTEETALSAARGAWPVIGLVERGRPTPPSLAWVQKWIAKPVHPADVVSAIASLTELDSQRASVVPKRQSADFVEAVRAAAERHDTRSLLALVNASGPFRFTSILRFDGALLSSVWTYDRDLPDADGFALDMPTTASYCSMVRDQMAPLAFEDSNTEPRVANHPSRYQVLSYCGAPLLGSDGSFFGTLCHYDLRPRTFSDATVAKLESSAQALNGAFVDAFVRTVR